MANKPKEPLVTLVEMEYLDKNGKKESCQYVTASAQEALEFWRDYKRQPEVDDMCAFFAHSAPVTVAEEEVQDVFYWKKGAEEKLEQYKKAVKKYEEDELAERLAAEDEKVRLEAMIEKQKKEIARLEREKEEAYYEGYNSGKDSSSGWGDWRPDPWFK